MEALSDGGDPETVEPDELTRAAASVIGGHWELPVAK